MIFNFEGFKKNILLNIIMQDPDSLTLEDFEDFIDTPDTYDNGYTFTIPKRWRLIMKVEQNQTRTCC